MKKALSHGTTQDTSKGDGLPEKALGEGGSSSVLRLCMVLKQSFSNLCLHLCHELQFLLASASAVPWGPGMEYSA